MTVARLALRSLANRWLTALLTVLAIAASVMLLIGVEKVRTGAKASFANTISGTDLIVGARSGGVQLLLYSVFRIGNATNNMSWRSYQRLVRRPEVKWTVPLSLGDSHRGFRVLGTTKAYFTHYRYRRDRKLVVAQGKLFNDLFDAVIGADVAAKLNYKVGSSIVVAHGLGALELAKHDELPFKVSGILAKTGTPVDRTVHVSLRAIEAIHIDWDGATRRPGAPLRSADSVRQMRLQPRAITAAMFGLKTRFATFSMQRYVNTYRGEALSAIAPALTLYELWGLIGTAERALVVVSIMVVVTALLGMITMILATLNERRREIAILRSLGAGPRTVIGLLLAEGAVLTAAGVVVGIIATYVALFALRPAVDRWYGLYLDIAPPGWSELTALGAIIIGGTLAALIPALRAYRQSLSDGMSVRS
ncbi:MAG: ABC transporter permease [Pseudomonadota bacterium]